MHDSVNNLTGLTQLGTSSVIGFIEVVDSVTLSLIYTINAVENNKMIPIIINTVICDFLFFIFYQFVSVIGVVVPPDEPVPPEVPPAFSPFS